MQWKLAPSLAVMLTEVNAAHPGRDKRTDGTISGYPGARSSHNYNSQGIVCALDITTGDYASGISTAQGQAMAEQLRIATRDQPRGITAYGIHYMAPPYVAVAGPKICSAPDYAWRHYNGSDLHKSHVHWSVDYDILTGEAPSGLADYNTTAPWGIYKLSGQGSGITPIKEDTLSAAEVQEIKLFTQKLIHEQTATIVAEIRAGNGVNRSTAQEAAQAERITIVREVRFNAERVLGVVEELATEQGVAIDYDRINTGLATALADGIKISGTITAGPIGEEPTT